jgi:micrococcal nuclease
VLLAALMIADRQGWLLVRRPDDLAAYHGVRTRVVRVIDGDTFEVDIPDRRHDRPVTRLRLWGVNSPDPAGPDHPAEPFAAEAARLARSLADGKLVTLYLESHRTRGIFGRVLAHVELPDASSLNEALVAAGCAKVDERWPHSRLDRYAQAQRHARRQGLGMWGTAVGTEAGRHAGTKSKRRDDGGA